MSTNTRQIWIEEGYKLFAKEGPKGMKVELLARRVGKSKSSFYHHFANLNIFLDALFDYHLGKTEGISQAARACKNIVPDLLNLILHFKQDVFFNRQLRIHRDLPNYMQYIEKSHQPIEDAFLGVWAEAIQLEEKSFLAQIVLKLAVDNFYMRTTEESLTYEWLLNYFIEIANMVQGIKKANE